MNSWAWNDKKNVNEISLAAHNPPSSTDLLFTDHYFLGHLGGLLWLLSDDILHLQWGLGG